MDIISIDKENFSIIEPLLKKYKYNDFRRYRRVMKEELYQYIKLEFLQLISSDTNCIICLLDKSKVIGVVSLSFLNWDSGHFNTKMAKIDYLISEEDFNKALFLKGKLLNEVVKICKKDNIVHLSCRVDTEDMSTIYALQKHGFRIMDTLVTRTYDKFRTSIPDIRLIYQARDMKDKDIKKLIKIAQVSFKNDRFHLDPFFDKKKSDELYAKWIENSFRNKEKIFVSVDRYDNPVGFLTYKLNKNFKAASRLLIMGKGLMTVSTKAKGALISLMRATFEDVDKFYDYVEYDTRLNNYEVLRICNYFNLEPVRAKYTFHKYLEL